MGLSLLAHTRNRTRSYAHPRLGAPFSLSLSEVEVVGLCLSAYFTLRQASSLTLGIKDKNCPLLA